MRPWRACIFLGVATGWWLAAGCGSGGDELFLGTLPVQGGNAGQGGVGKDASSDSSAGKAGQAGAAGTAGAAGSVGSGGSSGAAAGGAGGGAAGIGGSGAGGTAGTGGVSGAGGASGTGGTQTGGAAGTAGTSAGGAAGKGGSGGSGQPSDCSSTCGTSLCAGQEPTSGCTNCLGSTCQQAESRYSGAPNMSVFTSCISACSDQPCWQTCCSQQQRACWAYVLYGGCSCGYGNAACSSQCSASCTGGFMDTTCQDCVRDSPCGGALYDYYYAPNAADYSTCRSGCNADPGCQSGCCTSWPQACAARQAVVDCLCP